jgi:hypothetical protein
MAFNPLWIVIVMISILAWVVADGSFDALTVDVTPPNKTGLMQGVSWGGKGLGAAMGGIAFALMVSEMDWSSIVVVTGMLAVVQCLSGMIIKEPKVTRERLPNAGAFRKVIADRKTEMGIVYIFLVSAG